MTAQNKKLSPHEAKQNSISNEAVAAPQEGFLPITLQTFDKSLLICAVLYKPSQANINGHKPV